METRKIVTDPKKVTLDTSDVDRWIGIPLGGGEFKDSIHVNDVRRWAQGMQNPNPLYFDDDYAAESHFGRIVAPQSFAFRASTCCSAATSGGSTGRGSTRATTSVTSGCCSTTR
jgi:hypothetical protein